MLEVVSWLFEIPFELAIWLVLVAVATVAHSLLTSDDAAPVRLRRDDVPEITNLVVLHGDRRVHR